MTLELSHQPIVVGENGHLLATDGELFWVVVVTREALEAVTHQFDATVENLTSHAGLYLAIAEQHLCSQRLFTQSDLGAGRRCRPVVGFGTHSPGIGTCGSQSRFGITPPFAPIYRQSGLIISVRTGWHMSDGIRLSCSRLRKMVRGSAQCGTSHSPASSNITDL
ncbi:hypothetical protein [Rhizobium rhododendri]|uniref:Uncharacterized protein n=1 Tax=Rhizobium rhododendri TaxID=2506430 RepID=A0ABY8IPI3_9HYPH|nr:hypothetical protein [Rhizobium rhododendri]WFS25087.1 hypothetical protein PR018_22670 [Rhizobium rhododendri]